MIYHLQQDEQQQHQSLQQQSTSSPTNAFAAPAQNHKSQSQQQSPSLPPVVYGELSILGYNGYHPNVERNGRKNRGKFLLYQRPVPNGIKKSGHYIVKQPQSTKAVQNKDNYSISYTFSSSQTVVVEYSQDQNYDMFQIGRSYEEPIDFVVLDTVQANSQESSHQSNKNNHSSKNIHNHHNENNGSIPPNDHFRHLHGQVAKVSHDALHHSSHEQRSNMLLLSRHHQARQMMSISQPRQHVPSLMLDDFRVHNPPLVMQHHSHPSSMGHGINNFPANGVISNPPAHPPSSYPYHSHNQHETFAHTSGQISSSQYHAHQVQSNPSMNSHQSANSKRPHSTQSTISRFACRIIVDRRPPYTARLYAAGFDSSKNIFLGEKATKFECDVSIDGLTTNGILLMHPNRQISKNSETKKNSTNDINSSSGDIKGKVESSKEESLKSSSQDISDDSDVCSKLCSINEQFVEEVTELDIDGSNGRNKSKKLDSIKASNTRITKDINERNDQHDNNNNESQHSSYKHEEGNNPKNLLSGGVWREVSVDGGIYAIRESRSATQKGKRIETESNILQDGSLIDLCGATLLWRSLDGFKSAPTKKALEEKLDLLNANRPQCPVGLNTLVIPRKPILSVNQQHLHRHSKHQTQHFIDGSEQKNSHQPYVYLKCGHVQGYHDWGSTDKSNQRTCPICLSVGAVAKLSMGLEPSFYIDSGPLTHVFNPCGHMASEQTIKYWSSIKIPHGTHFFHSVCPFCATPLTVNDPTAVKLIFQDDCD